MTEERSDAELVGVCNRGGRDAYRAFETLYKRHKDYVVRVAMRATGSPELALDALQDTFSYLLTRFPPPGDGLTLTARLTTYLYPIARNYAVDHARRAGRLVGGEEPDELAGAGLDDEGRDLARVLARLPAERREILELRFIDDLSLADIAAALDIPLGTAKSRLHAAIQTLREAPETRAAFDP